MALWRLWDHHGPLEVGLAYDDDLEEAVLLVALQQALSACGSLGSMKL